MEEAKVLARQKADQMATPGWEDTVKPTNINRREAKRIRPLEVIGLGLERTGTLSLRAALYELGYFDVYHMYAIMRENPKDVEMWADAFEAKYYGKGSFPREKWDALTGHCMAAVDKPISLFGPELVEAYPEAKFILTVRDTPESWHKSVMNTIVPFTQIISPARIRHPGNNPINHILKFFAPSDAFARFSNLLCDASEVDRYQEEGAQMYLEHNAHMREIAPKGQLLEFNVKQGWEPLCTFLGKPIPDVPFPNINDTNEFMSRIRKVKYIFPLLYLGNMLKYVGAPALAAGLAYMYRGRLLGH
ncbi:Hypothetical protein R9X50_00670900 [Acrodontium crateriforme]|uniref:Sulfotransferase n=1 Tax=Acrodontium crateriforme TaxID=150365 RepID=A0AAQ3RBQ9_9PEZI|nr:Hypothetical protein R9X50_00670900 [Acrodontium crateriforme]